jgi:hypothetical protein
MQCHELEQYLEQQAGDPLPEAAAAHLNACGPCRALVADLEAIEAAAGQFSAEEAEPPERVWMALREQLESEGLIRSTVKVGWLPGWFGVMLRPALAGVYLAVLLTAAVLVATQLKLPPSQQSANVAGLQSAAASLHTQLNTVETRAVSAIRQNDPAVTASLRQNLDIVDNAIALCEKSFHDEPQNELAREYLYAAYQQKAELLAMMVDRGATGD